MNKRIVAYCFMSVMSLALILTSCPSPSSGGRSDDGDSQGYTVDFGHKDGASIEVTVDFSGMAERDEIDVLSVRVFEYDNTVDQNYQGYREVSISLDGHSTSFTIMGLRNDYWYRASGFLLDLYGNEFIVPGYCKTGTLQAVGGTELSEYVTMYSEFDGRYTEADKAELSGAIDISALDQSLVDTFEVSLSADDGDMGTDDPNLTFIGVLDGSGSISYRFINIDPDPAYAWQIDADIMDWNNSTLAKDEYQINSGTGVVAISSGINTKDFTAFHTFDTNDDYDGSNGKADLAGLLDLSNIPADTHSIDIRCSVNGSAYLLNYGFLNFDSEDTLRYQFTNLDPTKEHTLYFNIFTDTYASYSTEPSVTVPASDLSDGGLTTVDFILPAL